MDNKDIRGELDLMLAEAELKNLRRKKDRPWSWNRQVLAGCFAGSCRFRRLVLCQKPLPREGAGCVAAACVSTCGQAGAENTGAGCGPQDCGYTEAAS